MILSEATVPPYRYARGQSPLVVSMPHVGTYAPPSVARTFSDAAAQRPDTDWHLPRLYDFLGEIDATVITATHSRYVIDVNRPPDDQSLYPGQDVPGLCPLDSFDKRPVYREGQAPDAEEVRRRRIRYWEPYHRRLAAELARVRAAHGVAMLWEAHSIISEAPRFFVGRLPEFNLGTASGASCDAALAQRLLNNLLRYTGYYAVLNGRFKGGYITRHYGKPEHGIHAIQMEMSTSLYIHERCPFPFREDLAKRVRPILREQLELVTTWASSRRG